MTRCHETEVEHRAHNPKVAGSNPAPATIRAPVLKDRAVVVFGSCQTLVKRTDRNLSWWSWIGFVSRGQLAELRSRAWRSRYLVSAWLSEVYERDSIREQRFIIRFSMAKAEDSRFSSGVCAGSPLLPEVRQPLFLSSRMSLRSTPLRER